MFSMMVTENGTILLSMVIIKDVVDAKSAIIVIIRDQWSCLPYQLKLYQI